MFYTNVNHLSFCRREQTGLACWVVLFAVIVNTFQEWAIPENIHTIPRTAFRISEGEGGFTIMEFRRGGGVHDYGILRAWGGLCSFFNQGNAVFEVLIRKIKVQSSIIMCSVLVAIARVSILSL